MRRKHWIISSPGVRDLLTGEMGDYAHVWSKADLERRKAEGRNLGARVSVRKVKGK